MPERERQYAILPPSDSFSSRTRWYGSAIRSFSSLRDASPLYAVAVHAGSFIAALAGAVPSDHKSAKPESSRFMKAPFDSRHRSIASVDNRQWAIFRLALSMGDLS